MNGDIGGGVRGGNTGPPPPKIRLRAVGPCKLGPSALDAGIETARSTGASMLALAFSVCEKPIAKIGTGYGLDEVVAMGTEHT